MTDRGAHFYKCDFQVHTPRDLNWEGDGAVTEEERRTYATEIVAACRRHDLNAIGITDHHDIAFYRYIREAAGAETDELGNPLPPSKRLIVFPGVEVTLGIPCQALLLFDADFPVEFLPLALTALGVTPAAESDGKHALIQKIDIMSFTDLYAALNKLEPLRGHFIVFPHVSDGGHKTLLRKGFEKHYVSMPCVGGYVDGQLPTGAKSAGMRSITEGRDKNYGNKPLGLFQTSDNRQRNFDKLGKHATWVKWSRPAAEALRQACLARHSRISQAEPQLPAITIRRIEVSNSKFLGPFDIDLNPQYNAFIGGRGTGKSSILEYLRWALCDQPASTSDDELPDFQRRRASLVEKTLGAYSASVQVTVLLNNTEHTIRRNVDGRVLLKIRDGAFAEVSEQDVRTLLPIQAYSQKQLSSVGIKGDELRRFVHLPIQAQLDAAHSRLADTASQIRATHDAIREFRRLAKENSATKTELRSIEVQLAGLRDSLKGVSDEDRKLIAEQATWTEEGRVVASWRKEVVDALTEVRKLRATVQKLPSPGSARAAARTQTMEALLRQMFAEMSTSLEGAEAAIAGQTDTREKLKEAAAEWDAAAAENKKNYDEAKGRAAASESTLKQIGELERRQRELLEGVAQRDKRLAELGLPEDEFTKLLEVWRTLHQARTRLLEVQCEHLGKLSKGLLRATVAKGAGTEHATALLKELVKGSKMRTDKFDQLLEGVSTDADPVGAWLQLVAELRALSEIEAPATSSLPPSPRLASAGIGDADRRKIAEKLLTKGWGDFAVLELEDIPRFEYKAREGDYIGFAEASAGQQATALMFVLLNQDGPPLVIDQPEDDLDNHIIGDVVREVWVAKTKRQLIVSSHNANLVVNGDAELVVCCDYRTAGDQSGGTIKIQGAIDIDDVREEIASVMEGGREAFSLRKEKYGF